MKHFIAMSGTHGCLPDHCEVFESREAAISDLVQLFELGRTRALRLKTGGYLPLIPSPIETRQGINFGAEYCELMSCDCESPAVHSDSGQVF